jgi:hypothetical protein
MWAEFKQQLREGAIEARVAIAIAAMAKGDYSTVLEVFKYLRSVDATREEIIRARNHLLSSPDPTVAIAHEIVRRQFDCGPLPTI